MTFNVDKNFKSEGITPAEPNSQKNEAELSKLRQEAVKNGNTSFRTEDVITPPPHENKLNDHLEKIGIASAIDEALADLPEVINPQLGNENKKNVMPARKLNSSLERKIDDMLMELKPLHPINPKKYSGMKSIVTASGNTKIERVLPRMITTLHELPKIPNKMPSLPQTPYEKDMKIIQDWLKTPEGTTSLVGVDLKTRERHKFSRTYITDLTHSYVKGADGRLIQQMHKTNGLGLFHHIKDSKTSDHSDVVKGKGGFKSAMAMSDGAGGIRSIRAVVHRKGADLTNAISASKNPVFQKSDKLMVGHYVTYMNARSEIKEAFITDYMPGGDLDSKTLNFKDAINVSSQMAEALQIIHDEGWVHLDIKPGNMFHYVDDNKQYVVKLADFDLARNKENISEIVSIFSGTPAYISPEMMRDECYGFEEAKKSDIYSLGISMLELSGFSIWENFVNDTNNTYGKTNEEINVNFNEFIKGIKVGSPQHITITSDFEKFKQSLAPLKGYELDQLNLAWRMINPDPEDRPSIIDVNSDLLMISIDSTV
jgi:hypothetical protein